MKIKVVWIAVRIPAKYKWIAQHEWGDWSAFLKKPRIYKGEQAERCWYKQDYEITLVEGRGLPINEQWYRTATKI